MVKTIHKGVPILQKMDDSMLKFSSVRGVTSRKAPSGHLSIPYDYLLCL